MENMDKTYRTVGRAFNLAHKTITKRIQDNFEEYDIPQMFKMISYKYSFNTVTNKISQSSIHVKS